MEAIKISKTEIEAQQASSYAVLDGFTMSIPAPVTMGGYRSTTNTKNVVEVALIEKISASGNDPLPSVEMTKFVQTLRRGLSIAYVVADHYAKNTRLSSLIEQNKSKPVTDAELQTFKELQRNHAMIYTFVFCAYVVKYFDAGSDGDNQDFPFDNYIVAREKLLYALEKCFIGSTFENGLIAAVSVMKSVIKRINQVEKHNLDVFITRNYKVEDEDFSVHGFKVGNTAVAKNNVEMQFVKPEKVIGNHIAKHQLQRLARILVSYDPKTHTSPFIQLGGFPKAFFGIGKPGTGKTTVLQMLAYLVNEYCTVAGYEFRCRNLTVDQVSDYQGNSARNCRDMLAFIDDPNVIGIGAIDDIDQVAGKRGDRGASTGQLEITATLMGFLAGPNAVNRGNSTIAMFSNHPENVDPALIQRAGSRFTIDGPQSFEDYRDLLAILLGDFNCQALGFGESEGKLFETQIIKKVIADAYLNHNRPTDVEILNIYDRCVAQYGDLNDLHKISLYLKAIQEYDARFTGRAIKNIADNVKARLMDFDMPDEWFTNPELYLWKSTDAKISMIKGMMKPINHEIMLQEINRYVDNERRYVTDELDAQVEEILKKAKVQERVMERIKHKPSSSS